MERKAGVSSLAGGMCRKESRAASQHPSPHPRKSRGVGVRGVRCVCQGRGVSEEGEPDGGKGEVCWGAYEMIVVAIDYWLSHFRQGT